VELCSRIKIIPLRIARGLFDICMGVDHKLRFFLTVVILCVMLFSGVGVVEGVNTVTGGVATVPPVVSSTQPVVVTNRNHIAVTNRFTALVGAYFRTKLASTSETGGVLTVGALGVSLGIFIDGASFDIRSSVADTSLFSDIIDSGGVRRVTYKRVVLRINGVDNPLTVNSGNVGFVASVLNSVRLEYLNQLVRFGINMTQAVYLPYAEKQVSLGDGVTGVLLRQTTGTSLGGINADAVNYRFEAAYNPFFGRVVVGDIPSTLEEWVARLGGLEDFTSITIHEQYTTFVSGLSSPVSHFGVIGGVGSTTVSSGVASARRVVDFRLGVVTPSSFIRNVGFFGVNTDAFNLHPDLMVDIKNNTVLRRGADGGGFEVHGNAPDLNLRMDKMVLYFREVDGVKHGVLIPLLYREYIVDTSWSIANGVGLFFTGRSIDFKTNISNIKLNTYNEGILYASTELDEVAMIGGQLAFGSNVDLRERDSHAETPNNVPVFYVNTDFIWENNVGFVMFRNNWYLRDDASLLGWLRSDQARAMSNVEAETLYNLIMGNFYLDNEISFEEWLSIQAVRRELEFINRVSFYSAVNLVSVLLGVFIIFYSILLILFYYVDIFNTLMDISLLNIVTFGRIYPVASKDELEYMGNYRGDVKYVSVFDVIKLSILGLGAGAVILLLNPLLLLFNNMFVFLNRILGGG